MTTQTDWIKYIERESDLYLWLANALVYDRGLVEATGRGLKHMFFTYELNKGSFYVSESELIDYEKYLFKLLSNGSADYNVWIEKAYEYNQKAKNAILSPPSSFTEAAELFENVLLYGTVLPYRIINSIERAKENGSETPKTDQICSLFMNLRAESMYPKLLQNVMPFFWKKAAAITGIDPHLFSTITESELNQVFLTRKASSEEMKKRRTWCAIMYHNTKFSFYYDRNYLNIIGINENTNTSVVEGRTAFEGKVQGKVRIINKIENAGTINEKIVLVSINTNPTLTPIFEKCAAIITDEGGLACHASIVSRELKIPCIVGTKIATKVFKDGDFVEVDATNGIVRKI